MRTSRGGARLAAGEGLAAGDAGSELAEEGGFAETGIAVEDGDLAGGETAGREPLDGVSLDLTQAERGPRCRQARWLTGSSVAMDRSWDMTSSAAAYLSGRRIEHMFSLWKWLRGQVRWRRTLDVERRCGVSPHPPLVRR